jgi:U3 small nucleolar RNA-associated protein 22
MLYIIPEQAIDLIMASVYLDPGSLSIPSSPVSGLLRCIKWLSEWEWREEVVFVPVFSVKESEGQGRVVFPAEARKQGGERFERLKKSGRKGWILITEQDLSGLRWTSGISPVIAGRVRTLAKGMMDALQSSTESGKLDIRVSVFFPFTVFDANNK